MTTEPLVPEHTHLPSHDPADPVENAVITRLAKNWQRRASVKGAELDLDALYEPNRPDYPEGILPFHDHPIYQTLDPARQTELLAWAMVAFNRDTIDIEQHIANPGFTLLLNGNFPGVAGEAMHSALAQAMVDEQYHTLMHLNSSAVIRRARGWNLPAATLPTSYKAIRYQQLLEQAATDRFEQNLITLAFTTVAEVSISALLDLIADDARIQPVHSTTAKLHNRDEYCHASISAEMAKVVYFHLSTRQRQFFLTALAEGLDAFMANDFDAWRRIVDLVDLPGGQRMIDECQADLSRTRMLNDYSGLYRLCEQMDVVDSVGFAWSR
ncbi:MAG: diiron oxygenase [Pseudonocardiaceae bacterium]